MGLPDPLQMVGDLVSPAGYLRDTLAKPDSELGALGRQVKQAAKMMCDGYRANPGIKDLPGINRSYADDVCRPYWEQNGNTGPSLAPKFTGGQCVDVGYRLEWTFSGETANYTTSISVRGPIDIYLEVGEPLGNGKRFYNWILKQRTFDGGTALSSLGAEQATKEPGLAATLTRLDGLPDTCGNPPDSFKPGIGPTYVWGTPVTVPGGPLQPTVTIQVDEPSIDIDGNFNIPVTIDNTTNINLGFSSGGSEPVPTETITGSPIDGANPPPGINPNDVRDGDLPEPPDGFEYIGVAVALSFVGDPPTPIPNTNSNPVFPRTIGNLRLWQRVGQNEFLSENYPIREQQFSRTVALDGVVCTGWRFNAEPFIHAVFTPLMRTIK